MALAVYMSPFSIVPPQHGSRFMSVRSGETERLFVSVGVVENATDSLSRAVEFAAQTYRDPSAWKWVCIALHSALYGYSIAILGQGNPLPAWKTSTEEWERWVVELEKREGRKLDQYEILVETHRANREPHILSIKTAVRKAAKLVRFEHPASLSRVKVHLKKHSGAVEKLNAFRNTYLHYPPTVGWTLSVYDFIPVVEGVADVISMLICGSIEGRMLVPHCRREVGHYIEALRGELKAFGDIPEKKE